MIPTRASKPNSRRLRLAKAGLFTLAAAGAAGLSLVVSSCGSSGPPVAQVASTPSTTNSASSDDSKNLDPAAFSACMRKHGVPNFPDPDSKGGLTLNGNSGLDPRSPQFRAAQKACRKLLPNGGKMDPKAQAKALEQALEFSKCMRSHGVPNFPDPKASGGSMELSIPKSAGINPNSPQFKAAQKACQKLLPGQGGTTQSRGPGATP
jgi:hypothetical protein